MAAWSSYTLDDFLLFSLPTYERLFELHNRALWPGHLLVLVAIVVLVHGVLTPAPANRTVYTLLGVIWIWLAGSFFLMRLQPINWFAVYLAPVIALQGVILLIYGWVGKFQASVPASAVGRWMAIGLLIFGLLGYPLSALVLDRPWQEMEIFALAPDPTAVATLAVLAGCGRAAPWPLWLIPGLWCGWTGLTLWALQSPAFFMAPTATVVALLIGLAAWLRRRTAAPV